MRKLSALVFCLTEFFISQRDCHPGVQAALCKFHSNYRERGYPCPTLAQWRTNACGRWFVIEPALGKDVRFAVAGSKRVDASGLEYYLKGLDATHWYRHVSPPVFLHPRGTVIVPNANKQTALRSWFVGSAQQPLQEAVLLLVPMVG